MNFEVFPISLDDPMPDVDISRAVEIDGWMSEVELIWLGKMAREHSCIVEIGSFCGRSTRILGENTSGSVYAVDDFKGSRESYVPKHLAEWIEQHQPWIQECFRENLRDLIENGKVVPINCDHGAINLDVTPDMVFLDGDHEYPNVVRDLLFWKDRLAPGGLLCGHDINESGVERALKDVIGETRTIGNTSIWIA